MKVISYPDQEVVDTYLSVGCEIEFFIVNEGETVLLSSDCCEQTLETLFINEGYTKHDFSQAYRLKLHKDYVKWTYQCPVFYKQLKNKNEIQKAYYKDGYQLISSVLSNLNYFVEIRLDKTF